MAEKRSEYYFTSDGAYEGAKDVIYNQSHSAYSKLYWEGKVGDNYYVSLYDDLTIDEIELVARAIREFGGTYYHS